MTLRHHANRKKTRYRPHRGLNVQNRETSDFRSHDGWRWRPPASLPAGYRSALRPAEIAPPTRRRASLRRSLVTTVRPSEKFNSAGLFRQAGRPFVQEVSQLR